MPQSHGNGLPPRGRSLKTLQQVRRLASDAVRYVEKLGPEEITPTDRARLMLYGAQILGRIIPLADLEPRLKALELKRQQPEAPH